MVAVLRRFSLVEGISTLVLFLVAMPLKYVLGYPMAVTYVGWVHGVLFDRQKEEYLKAKARLDQYELANGLKGVVRTESIWDDKSESYVDKDIIGYVVEPLPLYIEPIGRNPVVVQDEIEREAAQEIINKTPQSVINSISN